MRHLIFATVVVFFLPFVRNAQLQHKDTITTLKFSKEAEDVSIQKVLENPERYNGKKIRLVGFLNINFETDALYINKSDCLNSLTQNAISVHINMRLRTVTNVDICNKKQVIVEGVFDARDYGHENLFGGALKDISLLKLWQHQPTKSK